MKEFIGYPSIEQYRNVVKGICISSSYIGKEEGTGKPMYDPSRPRPKVIFEGTVKLHGTNAGVCFNQSSGMWAQSRKNIITPDQDNVGFATFIESKSKILMNFMDSMMLYLDIHATDETISIFGEWCGQGIQKGVGISELPKMFVMFGVKITPNENRDDAFWLDFRPLNLCASDDNIYSIHEFPSYEMEIDFNKPEEFQNRLNDITAKVEEKCPVAASLGISGIGEGVVWKGVYNGDNYRFKVKGDKHSKTKVKKLPAVDDEKLALINGVVNSVTPACRLEQGIQEVFDTLNGGEVDRTKLGDYIRWVIGDIMKEDLDIITEAGLNTKDVNGKISKVVKDYFFGLEQF